jgi:hypothetical protein
MFTYKGHDVEVLEAGIKATVDIPELVAVTAIGVREHFHRIHPYGV